MTDTDLQGTLGSSATDTTADPTWITEEASCVKGGCLDFTSANSEYVSTNYSQTFEEERTYSVWFKTNDTGNYKGIMVDRGDSPDGITINEGNLYFRIRSGTGVTTTETYSDNTWHHAVLTYNGNSTAKAYVDGIFQTDVNAGSLTGSEEITLGVRSATVGGYLDGLIDEVQIFNYTLSPSEVKAVYNQGAVNFK